MFCTTSVLEKCLQPTSCSSIKKISWIWDTFPKPKSCKTMFLTTKAFNNATETHSNFVILLENTFLDMLKIRAWSIFTLSMPWVKTYQIQNLALFWDWCKSPKSVISGDLSKNCYVWATQWPTSCKLKIKFDPSLEFIIIMMIKNYGPKNPHAGRKLGPEY